MCPFSPCFLGARFTVSLRLIFTHAPAALYPGKDTVPSVQNAGWAPGLIWTAAENLAPTGIRSPDRPASRYTDYATFMKEETFIRRY